MLRSASAGDAPVVTFESDDEASEDRTSHTKMKSMSRLGKSLSTPLPPHDPLVRQERGDISRSSTLLGSKSSQSLNAFAVHTNPLSGVASPGAAWADQVHRHGAKIGSGGQFSFKYSTPLLEGAASLTPMR